MQYQLMLQAGDLLSENLQTWRCRLFQLAIVRGKKLYWMNCLVITGSRKASECMCREGLIRGISWGKWSRATMPCNVLYNMTRRMSVLLCWRLRQCKRLIIVVTRASGTIPNKIYYYAFKT